MVGRHWETPLTEAGESAPETPWALMSCCGSGKVAASPSSLRLGEKDWFRPGREPSINLTVPRRCWVSMHTIKVSPSQGYNSWQWGLPDSWKQGPWRLLGGSPWIPGTLSRYFHHSSSMATSLNWEHDSKSFKWGLFCFRLKTGQLHLWRQGEQPTPPTLVPFFLINKTFFLFCFVNFKVSI